VVCARIWFALWQIAFSIRDAPEKKSPVKTYISRICYIFSKFYHLQRKVLALRPLFMELMTGKVDSKSKVGWNYTKSLRHFGSKSSTSSHFGVKWGQIESPKSLPCQPVVLIHLVTSASIQLSCALCSIESSYPQWPNMLKWIGWCHYYNDEMNELFIYYLLHYRRW